MRTTWCLGCGVQTFNGSRCVPCNRGLEKATRNPARNRPEWRKRSKRDIAAHVARYSWWCPGYGVPPHHSRDLTSDHIDPLALGGAVLGETQVLCRGCNTRKRRSARGHEKVPVDGHHEVPTSRLIRPSG